MADRLAQILFEIDLWENNPEVAVLLMLLEEEDDRRPSTYDPTGKKFDIDDLNSAQCRLFFRFEKADLFYLADCLRLPDEFKLENRCVVNKVDALCMFLARLSYPIRLVSLESFFNRPKSTVSMTIKEVLNHIYDNFGHKLQDLDQPWLRRRWQQYADVIHEKGAPLTNVIGFIDGTVRSICRPVSFQRVVYNGHKRVHALKFQSIVTPDGLISNLFGPMEGRRHDCALLAESGILDQFEEGQWIDRDGAKYAIYGDPAYPLRECILAPYRNPQDPDEQEFNRRMSSVRESVEWQFGKLIKIFAFLDFKKDLKVFLQPVAKMYLVGAILVNCHTILYGSQTGRYFQMDPPTLEEYLG